MLNKVMIIGHLGKDPELKYSPGGGGAPICNLRIATDESYTDRDGNKVDRTEWHRVVVFQKAAENCANYPAKGSLVFVEGNLQTRKWQGQDGQDRYMTEIRAQRVQFLDRRGDSTGGEGGLRPNSNQARPKGPTPPDDPDDLPPTFPSETSEMDKVPF